MNVNHGKNIDHGSRPRQENSIQARTTNTLNERTKASESSISGIRIEKQARGPNEKIINKTMASTKEGQKVKRKRKSPVVPWKKPKDMPKRPLSAYNLFFQDRRKSIMEELSKTTSSQIERNSRGKPSKKRSGIGFANLARKIGSEWKVMGPESKAPYEQHAAAEKQRYDREMIVWREKERNEKLAEKNDPLFGNALMDFSVGIPSSESQFGAKRKSDRMLGVKEERGTIIDMVREKELERIRQDSIQASSTKFFDSIDNLGTNAQEIQMQRRQIQQRMNHGQGQSLRTWENSNMINLFGYPNQMTNSLMQKDNQALLTNQDQFGFQPLTTATQNLSSNLPGLYQNEARLRFQNELQGNSNLNDSELQFGQTGQTSNFPTMSNIFPPRADLEPLPLPNGLQQRRHHQEMDHAFVGERRQSLSNQELYRQPGLMSSTERYLRRLSIGGPLNTWFERNTNVPLDPANRNEDASNNNRRVPSTESQLSPSSISNMNAFYNGAPS